MIGYWHSFAINKFCLFGEFHVSVYETLSYFLIISQQKFDAQEFYFDHLK